MDDLITQLYYTDLLQNPSEFPYCLAKSTFLLWHSRTSVCLFLYCSHHKSYTVVKFHNLQLHKTCPNLLDLRALLRLFTLSSIAFLVKSWLPFSSSISTSTNVPSSFPCLYQKLCILFLNSCMTLYFSMISLTDSAEMYTCLISLLDDKFSEGRNHILPKIVVPIVWCGLGT